MEINRLSMQGNQANFSLAKFKEVRIPKFDDKLQLKIEQILYRSHKKLEESKQLYNEAEELLLSELGLLDFTPNNDNIAIKSFSDSFSVSGRLDSEYYQPKYDDIEQKIYSKPHTFINKEFSQITTSFDKTKYGYNYIEIGDVNVSDGVHSYNYVVTEELPANAKIKVANGDLIVSTVRPYRGAVSIINTEDTDLVVSGAFTVLRSKLENNYSTQVLQVLLRTQIYKDFMLKYNVGSSYPVIKDENIMNLPIPLLSDKVQEKIEAKIKQSFALKERSKQLLDLAKRAVEVAIEDSEQSAMELISAGNL
jgi:type I restriction enzyme S subunit